MIPVCTNCGLKMRHMFPYGLDWWDCECGNCYDRKNDYWAFEESMNDENN